MIPLFKFALQRYSFFLNYLTFCRRITWELNLETWNLNPESRPLGPPILPASSVKCGGGQPRSLHGCRKT